MRTPAAGKRDIDVTDGETAEQKRARTDHSVALFSLPKI